MYTIADEMSFATWIRRYLDELEISQAQFAREIGKSPSYVSQFLNEYNYSTEKPIKPTSEFVRRTVSVLNKHGAGVSEYEAFKEADLGVPDEPTEPGEEAVYILDQLTRQWAKIRRLNTENETDKAPEGTIDSFLDLLRTEFPDAYERPARFVMPRTGPANVPEHRDPVYEWEAAPGETTEYVLPIRGYSMDPGIQDGDHVIVRRDRPAKAGDIVVATVNGESTVKLLIARKINGSVVPVLKPFHGGYQEISVGDITIQGVVEKAEIAVDQLIDLRARQEQHDRELTELRRRIDELEGEREGR